jgi:hypothetical protein
MAKPERAEPERLALAIRQHRGCHERVDEVVLRVQVGPVVAQPRVLERAEVGGRAAPLNAIKSGRLPTAWC